MHNHHKDAFSKARIQMSAFLFPEPSWEDGRLSLSLSHFRDVSGDLPWTPAHIHRLLHWTHSLIFERNVNIQKRPEQLLDLSLVVKKMTEKTGKES